MILRFADPAHRPMSRTAARTMEGDMILRFADAACRPGSRTAARTMERAA